MRSCCRRSSATHKLVVPATCSLFVSFFGCLPLSFSGMSASLKCIRMLLLHNHWVKATMLSARRANAAILAEVLISICCPYFLSTQLREQHQLRAAQRIAEYKYRNSHGMKGQLVQLFARAQCQG